MFGQKYRYLIDDYSWERPGGKVEIGETEEEGSIRECFEEINCLCESVEPLVSFHPGIDTLFNPTAIFFLVRLKNILLSRPKKFLILNGWA